MVKALGAAKVSVVVFEGAEIVIGGGVFAVLMDGAGEVEAGVGVGLEVLVGDPDFIGDFGGLGEFFIGADGVLIVLTGGEEVGGGLGGHGDETTAGSGGGGGLLVIVGHDAEEPLLGEGVGGEGGAEGQEKRNQGGAQDGEWAWGYGVRGVHHGLRIDAGIVGEPEGEAAGPGQDLGIRMIPDWYA